MTSSDGKAYFRQNYGDWDSMDEEHRAQSMADFLYRRKEQADEEQLRKTRTMMEDVMRPYQETLRGFAELMDKRFGDINNTLGRVIGKQNEADKRLGDLELRALTGPGQAALPPASGPYTQTSMVGTPTGIQPKIVVYAGHTQKMDCRYREKGGPKECIIVESTDDGRYGTCTVGDQVRRMQILPRWFTTAFEKAGCPSNKFVRPCEYYLAQRVKLS
ncbi:hypothetical protein HYV81_02745 [Candidatus Woesearchaeota archaeon]|nr:hypothetical protein [Candidatus Woesearchaeota archaeon]